MMPCSTRREGDEIVCHCGKRWAVDDLEPPGCPEMKPPPNYAFATGARDPFESQPDDRRFHIVEFPTVTLQLPVELPEGLAQKMAIAFQHQIEHPTGHLVRDPAHRSKAMRAAYRILLDELSK